MDATLQEMKIHWKSDTIIKKWNSKEDLKIQNKQIPSVRKPLPLQKIVKQDQDLKIYEFHECYFFQLDKGFEELKQDDNLQLPFKKYQFKLDDTNLTVTILPELPISQMIGLPFIIDHLSTDTLIKNDVDYQLIDEDVPTKTTLFQEDYSVWDQTIRVIQTEKHTIYFAILRRIYLPPDADDYQDIIFELKTPNENFKFDKFVKMVHSFNPLPQGFFYDLLLIRARLESLNGDEDFFTWTHKILKLKLELLPLNSMIESTKFSRLDMFGKTVAKLLGLEVGEQVIRTYTDPFIIEQDIFSNCDSPDTIEKPSQEHLVEKRFKLSKFLAFYCDGVFDSKLDFSFIISKMKESKLAKQLMSYFLHLHKINSMYDFDTDLKSEIELLEKSSIATMNYQVLIKLLKTDFFKNLNYGPNDHSLAKLLCIAFKNIKDQTQISLLCECLPSLDLNNLMSYNAFQETMTNLFRSNVNSILNSVTISLINLSGEKLIKYWILNNINLLINHLISGKNNVSLINHFLLLMKNVMDVKETREILIDKNVIPSLFMVIKGKFTDKSSNERIKMFENAIFNLYLLSTDDTISSLYIKYNAIDRLQNIFNNTNNQSLHSYISGIFLVLSSVTSLKEDIIKREIPLDLIKKISLGMGQNLTSLHFLKFIKNSCGCLLMLSTQKSSIEQMKSVKFQEIIESLEKDEHVNEDNTTKTILMKLGQHFK